MPDQPRNVRPIIVGNWKMNGLRAALAEAERIRDGLGSIPVDAMICPPATLIASLAQLASGTPLHVGAQDCHAATSGAHTGDVSAAMLKDAGATAVIVGHSERRADHGERDADVRTKAQAVLQAAMTAIICVGETAGERRAGLTLDVVGRQLQASVPESATADTVVVAYEPVWAIGTGLTATSQDVAQVHAFLRTALARRFGAQGERIRLLYGGSVRPANAAELLSVAHVNGALVGGASLKATDFLGIIAACPK